MALQTDLPMLVQIYNDIRKFEFHHYCPLSTTKTPDFPSMYVLELDMYGLLDVLIRATLLSNLKKIHFLQSS